MRNTFYSDSYYDRYDSLVHYGVKGMRWGVRKGGPKTPYQSSLNKKFITKGKISLSALNVSSRTRNDDGQSKVYTWKKGSEFVGTILVDTIPASDGYKWIGSLRVTAKYRGHDLGKQIVEFAKKEGGGALAVDKKNAVAKKVYEDCGFIVDRDSDDPNYFIMRYPPNRSDELAHYGVKGMHWGIRKDRLSTKHTKTPVNTKYLDGYNGPAYFISERKMGEHAELSPRVPSNFFTQNGYEDSKTPRVCFASDVGKCLTALSQNVTGKTYYVYKPTDASKIDFYRPSIKAVPDSEVTGEMWVTEKVAIKPIGKIQCTGDDGKDGLLFRYGDHKAELYNWNYKWIR